MEFETERNQIKKHIKAFLLNRLGYSHVAWCLLVLEFVIFLSMTVWIVAGLIDLAYHCWLGRGHIEVVDRYYQVGDGPTYRIMVPGEERLVIRTADENILLGIKLSLKKQCYCPDGEIYAEVHNFKGDDVTGEFVKITLGREEERLSPSSADVTTLEGDWIKLPDGRYRVEIWLKCSSRPKEPIIWEYATFKLKTREEK